MDCVAGKAEDGKPKKASREMIQGKANVCQVRTQTFALSKWSRNGIINYRNPYQILPLSSPGPTFSGNL